MALVIRLQRTGKPKHPHFRVVAIEKSRGAQGQPVEILGHYHPRADKLKDRVVLDKDRYAYWVGKGAKPSDTMRTLVKQLDRGDAEAKA